MSYRFLRITSLYNKYLHDYYNRNSAIVESDYLHQCKQLMNDGFAVSDYLESALQKLGYETHFIVENAHHLQAAWARENKVRKRGKDLVNEQIRAIRPDVVYVENSYKYNVEWVKHIKESVPSIKLVIGHCCSPVNEDHISSFKAFDFMVTCTPGFVSLFRDNGLRAFLIYHAFEPEILGRLDVENDCEEIGLFFAGGLSCAEGFHGQRLRLVQSLIDKDINVSLHCDLDRNRLRIFLKQVLYYSFAGLSNMGLRHVASSLPLISHAGSWASVPKLPNYSKRLIDSVRKPLFGIEMLKAMRKSKIGFNTHGDVAGEYAGNIRMFEVTGVGSCLVTDHKKNISDLFESGTEIVTYRSADEAVENIRWLLDHPDKMKEIADAGHARTLRSHNYSERAKILNILIEKNMP